MGRPKGSKNKGKGAKSTDALLKGLGAKGAEAVKRLQQNNDRDTLLAAYRTYPRLPASTETMLAELSDAKAKEIRATLLKVV